MNENKPVELCNMTEYDAHNIGAKIKEVSYSHNITIKELSARAGISENGIQQMAKNGKMPRVDTLARIADVLAVSVDFLLDRPAPVIPGSPNLANLDTAVSVVAAAADLPPDYIRGILHLPPRSSTTNDI